MAFALTNSQHDVHANLCRLVQWILRQAETSLEGVKLGNSWTQLDRFPRMNPVHCFIYARVCDTMRRSFQGPPDYRGMFAFTLLPTHFQWYAGARGMVSDCLVDVKNEHEENQGISPATAPLSPFGSPPLAVPSHNLLTFPTAPQHSASLILHAFDSSDAVVDPLHWHAKPLSAR